MTFNAATNDRHLIVVGGNRTFAVSGDHDGQVILVIFKQDGSGGHTIAAWWSGITWLTPDGGVPSASATPPTLDAGANRYTLITIIRLGSGNYLGSVAGVRTS